MNQVRKVLQALCRSVGTPRALAIHTLAREGEWTQIQSLRVSPYAYQSPDAYFKDALVTELIRKMAIPGDEKRKEQVAKDGFWASETQCCRTNARLSRFLPENLFLEDGDESVAHFISEWRKEVKLGLGVLPQTLTPRFSGGATFADVGKLITIPDKMSSIPTTYRETACLLPFWWDTSWGRAVCSRGRTPTVVPGNIFFTVVKDNEKHRGCGKEASIPVALQLSVGRAMRVGLKRFFGIDLRSGQEAHKKIAHRASIDGRDATLDMSNASDTVCRILVKLGFPKDWFTLLDSLRAPKTRIDGKWVRLEKFSSMGNGFTFELETLIFASLARTLVRLEGGDPDRVSCYGDDLIVPTEHAKSMLGVLSYFGFTPNLKKSFWEGPFRESCGGDFYSGEPVRACYLEEIPNEPQHWISLANGLRRVDPQGLYTKSAWMECLKNIPSDIRRCRGPVELGDLVIHDSPEHHNVRRTPREGGQEAEVVYRVYRPVAQPLPWHHWYDDIIMACAVIGVPSTGIIPRDGPVSYKLAWSESFANRQWLPQAS